MSNKIIAPENLVYKKPTLMNDTPMHYCPGCSHGVVHKLVAEVIEEMGMEEKTVGVCPVGCAVFAYRYLDIDWQEAAHGRAPAVATAVKRLWPNRLVLPIKVTAIWLASVQLRQYMPLTAANILPLSLSTMPFMA